MDNLPSPAEAFEKISNLSGHDYEAFMQDFSTKLVRLKESNPHECENYHKQLSELQLLDIKIFFDDKLKPLIKLIDKFPISDRAKEIYKILLRKHHDALTSIILENIEKTGLQFTKAQNK